MIYDFWVQIGGFANYFHIFTAVDEKSPWSHCTKGCGMIGNYKKKRKIGCCDILIMQLVKGDFRLFLSGPSKISICPIKCNEVRFEGWELELMH